MNLVMPVCVLNSKKQYDAQSSNNRLRLKGLMV